MDEVRYRQAEEALFADAGITPVEHRIRVTGVEGDVRVLEVGEGEPVLFLHGGPNAAATWAYVAAEVSRHGIRCLLLDRPGCGLSARPSTVPDASSLGDYLARLSVDVLDALDLESVTVVGSSLGGFAALQTAAASPDRVRRVVLAGCPAFVPDWTPPGFFALLRRPLTRALLLRSPATRSAAAMSLRMMGHRVSVKAGRIPDPMIGWIRAWQAFTDTMRNDTAMIVACGDRTAFDPRLDLTPADLAAITVPVTALFGADDPVGGRDVGETLVAALPNATLDVLPDGGHLPWLDDPAWLAGAIRTAVRAG